MTNDTMVGSSDSSAGCVYFLHLYLLDEKRKEIETDYTFQSFRWHSISIILFCSLFAFTVPSLVPMYYFLVLFAF